MKEQTKRIAYCSFKGGSGRTVALANTAVRLACRGFKVGCIDLDIESCGLNEVFGISTIPPGKREVQDFFITGATWRIIGSGDAKPLFESNSNFDELVLNIDLPSLGNMGEQARKANGSIDLIFSLPRPRKSTAALRNEAMVERTSELFTRFASIYKLDYLLVDCRSGVSTLTLPGLRWCHEVLMFFRPGRQHYEGTKRMLFWLIDDRNKRLQNVIDDTNDAHLPERISVVPSAVPLEAKSGVIEWLNKLTKDIDCPQLRGLDVLSDDSGLRVVERIATNGIDDSDSKVATDFDRLVDSIAI